MMETPRKEAVQRFCIPADSALLPAELVKPEQAQSVVVLACHNPANERRPEELELERALRDADLATLRVDLMTEQEASGNPPRPGSLSILSRRVQAIARKVHALPATAGLDVGYYASGSAACAALRVARRERQLFDALVICELGGELTDSKARDSKLPMAAVFGGPSADLPSLVNPRPDPELVKDLFKTWLRRSGSLGLRNGLQPRHTPSDPGADDGGRPSVELLV